MSEAKVPVVVQSPPSRGEDAPMGEVMEGSSPACVAVGDRFEKRGRRVITWQVKAIAHPPHVSPIITFAEIDGTAHLHLHVADIFKMGFYRIGESRSLT